MFSVSMFIHTHAFINACQVVHLKSVHYTIYVLYFLFFFNVEERKGGRRKTRNRNQKTGPWQAEGGELEQTWQQPEEGLGCRQPWGARGFHLILQAPPPCVPPVHSKWNR